MVAALDEPPPKPPPAGILFSSSIETPPSPNTSTIFCHAITHRLESSFASQSTLEENWQLESLFSNLMVS